MYIQIYKGTWKHSNAFEKHYSLKYIKIDDFCEIGKGLGEEINLKIHISRAIKYLCIFKKYKVSKIKERETT